MKHYPAWEVPAAPGGEEKGSGNRDLSTVEFDLPLHH
jgi:hypothetical protein